MNNQAARGSAPSRRGAEKHAQTVPAPIAAKQATLTGSARFRVYRAVASTPATPNSFHHRRPRVDGAAVSTRHRPLASQLISAPADGTVPAGDLSPAGVPWTNTVGQAHLRSNC